MILTLSKWLEVFAMLCQNTDNTKRVGSALNFLEEYYIEGEHK